MDSTVSSTGNLLTKLAVGWQPSHCVLGQELVQLWREKLNAPTEIKEINENGLYFVTNLSDIRLRGMEQVACLVLAGDRADIAQRVVQEFWKKADMLGSVPVVLTLSAEAHKQALACLPCTHCLILSATQVVQLFDADAAQQFLKRSLWQRIGKRRLIPYTILNPVVGNMFFGRRYELSDLRDGDNVSYAVAGPSRIGKTSLVMHFRDTMLREHDPRSSRRFYISFYSCQDKSAYGVAHFFAMQLDASSRSNRVTPESLVNFLLYQRSRLGGPLDLLLDEVDEVCQSEAFQCLGEAARHGYCRLVLCGRGVLLRMMLRGQSSLACRLKLLRLQPLDEDSARRLILEPLTDLGFSVSEPGPLVNHVSQLTGRLPHLLQFYGQKLAELAAQESVESITMRHVESIKWDFETAQYFLSPLQDLTSPEVRLIALSLLQSGIKQFSIPGVRSLAEKQGIILDQACTIDICNELVINNVLSWNNGSFCIANEAMEHYAREMGLLDDALHRSSAGVKGTFLTLSHKF